MTYELPPMAGLVNLPRPTAASRQREDVVNVVTLGGGAERRYVAGYRYVFALSWALLTEANANAIEAAFPYGGGLDYRHVDGTVASVYVSGAITRTPVAGTDPVKHAVSVELREPGVRR